MEQVVKDFDEAAQNAKEELMSEKTWEEMNLRPELVTAVHNKGFQRPTVIQAHALPIVLGSNSNYIGQAKNGSGKTAAFVLAALNKVDETIAAVQAIIISPTRELAVQNLNVLKTLGAFTKIVCELGCPPTNAPSRNAHILSGTPGKLHQWVTTGVVPAETLKLIVFDEADNLLNDGFHQNMQNISNTCPNAQRLLFSATFPQKVRGFAMEIAPNAQRKLIKHDQLNVTSLCQLWCRCKADDWATKNQAVDHCISFLNAGQCMVFCNTVKAAQNLAYFLHDALYSVTLLVAKDMPAAARDQRMYEFRTKVTTVLVTTDLLSRGVDVPTVNFVVNYDMPVLYENGKRTNKAASETYLHRVGRAGRMGRRGFSLSFISNDEEKQFLDQITEEYQLPVHEIPDDMMEIRTLLKKLDPPPKF